MSNQIFAAMVGCRFDETNNLLFRLKICFAKRFHCVKGDFGDVWGKINVTIPKPCEN